MKTTISLFKLLHGMYATKVPVIVFGNAGIGKTSIIKQLGKTLGVTTITKSSSKVTDVDLSGIPYLQEIAEKNTKTDVVNQKMHKEVRISVPTYIQQLTGDPNGILFFDELGTAPIDIQKQMLSGDGIEEEGSHEELLKKRGSYYRLWNQLTGEDGEKSNDSDCSGGR